MWAIGSHWYLWSKSATQIGQAQEFPYALIIWYVSKIIY